MSTRPVASRRSQLPDCLQKDFPCHSASKRRLISKIAGVSLSPTSLFLSHDCNTNDNTQCDSDHGHIIPSHVLTVQSQSTSRWRVNRRKHPYNRHRYRNGRYRYPRDSTSYKRKYGRFNGLQLKLLPDYNRKQQPRSGAWTHRKRKGKTQSGPLSTSLRKNGMLAMAAIRSCPTRKSQLSTNVKIKKEGVRGGGKSDGEESGHEEESAGVVAWITTRIRTLSGGDVGTSAKKSRTMNQEMSERDGSDKIDTTEMNQEEKEGLILSLAMKRDFIALAQLLNDLKHEEVAVLCDSANPAARAVKQDVQPLSKIERGKKCVGSDGTFECLYLLFLYYKQMNKDLLSNLISTWSTQLGVKQERLGANNLIQFFNRQKADPYKCYICDDPRLISMCHDRKAKQYFHVHCKEDIMVKDFVLKGFCPFCFEQPRLEFVCRCTDETSPSQNRKYCTSCWTYYPKLKATLRPHSHCQVDGDKMKSHYVHEECIRGWCQLFKIDKPHNDHWINSCFFCITKLDQPIQSSQQTNPSLSTPNEVPTLPPITIVASPLDHSPVDSCVTLQHDGQSNTPSSNRIITPATTTIAP